MREKCIYALAWEQRKLGDVVEICSGRDYKHLSEGDIPVYGTGGYMLSMNEALSENEDAIGIGRKGTIDKPYLLRAPFWTVDTLFYAIPREKNDLNFMYAIFRKIKWKQKDESTGVPSLSKTTINATKIHTPKTDEQIKMGELFHQIDKAITLHQRKLETLKSIKQGYLQQLFPKNGDNVPTLRFADFEGDWEQRKLVREVEFYSGLTYLPENVLLKNGTLVLRSSNINNGEIVNADNVYVNSDVVNSNNVQLGDIIVVVRNGSRNLIGKHAQVKKKMNNTVIGAFMTGVRSEIPNFTNALLNTEQFNMEINKNLGATINQITTGSFKKMKFFIPVENPEKEMIGNLFNHLDNLITLHKRKTDALNLLKKSYLQKMFI